MPWIEEEDDEEFLSFIKTFETDTRPEILSVLARHSEKKLFVFHTREEADGFLAAL
jgi:hypothetical protein